MFSHLSLNKLRLVTSMKNITCEFQCYDPEYVLLCYFCSSRKCYINFLPYLVDLQDRVSKHVAKGSMVINYDILYT